MTNLYEYLIQKRTTVLTGLATLVFGSYVLSCGGPIKDKNIKPITQEERDGRVSDSTAALTRQAYESSKPSYGIVTGEAGEITKSAYDSLTAYPDSTKNR